MSQNVFKDFLVGGIAAVGAGFFTNPMETVKIRMQLQGELAARGQKRVFKNTFHAAYLVAKTEGILALQNGLVPALWTQFFLNGCRYGLYQWADNHNMIRDANNSVIIYKSVFFGLVGGGSGAFVANPFFLIKTQLQSKAAESIAVGTQHEHGGSFRALYLIHKKHGIKGLWRGTPTAVPRAMVGSSAQLTSFTLCKQWFRDNGLFLDSPILATFFASMVGGVAISLAINPLDLISVRIYNQAVDAQGRGLLYTGVIDCIAKIWKTEGFMGFYKGLIPNYIRLGPHSVLCLVFWEKMKELRAILDAKYST